MNIYIIAHKSIISRNYYFSIPYFGFYLYYYINKKKQIFSLNIYFQIDI